MQRPVAIAAAILVSAGMHCPGRRGPGPGNSASIWSRDTRCFERESPTSRACGSARHTDQRRERADRGHGHRPDEGNLFREKVPGAFFVGNAFGNLPDPPGSGTRHDRNADSADQHAGVGTAMDAVVRWTLERPETQTCVR